MKDSSSDQEVAGSEMGEEGFGSLEFEEENLERLALQMVEYWAMEEYWGEEEHWAMEEFLVEEEYWEVKEFLVEEEDSAEEEY